MKNILLLRHSEPQKNTGLANEAIPLSETGRELAVKLFTHLWFRDVTCVYTSPYERAYGTAVAGGLRVISDDRLVERQLGNPRTLTAEFWGKQYEDPDYKNVDGESFREVCVRMESCLQDILTRMKDGETVAVVSHAAAICAYLMTACTVTVTDAVRKLRRIEYGSKTVLDGGIATPAVFRLTYDGTRLIDVDYIDCRIWSL